MLLIKNAKIYTMTDEIIENGDILVGENGKIAQIGTDLKPYENSEIIDAKGFVVIPGIVDAHTHYNQCNYKTGEVNNNEMTMINPTLDALYSINTGWGDFETGLSFGITTVCIIPGSGNLVGGHGLVTKTYGDDIFKMTIKHPSCMKAAVGRWNKMTTAQTFKDLFKDTKAYIENDQTPFNPKFNVFVPVLKGELQLKLHCGGVDMIHLLDICKEYGIKLSLEHAVGADKYIDEIAKSKCDVVIGPWGLMRYENLLKEVNACIELIKRGTNVSIMTDGATHGAQTLINHVGEMVKAGLDVSEALKLITINAAKNLGVDDRLGSIEVGKDADLAIFTAIPGYEVKADVKYAIVEGKVVYKNE